MIAVKIRVRTFEIEVLKRRTKTWDHKFIDDILECFEIVLSLFSAKARIHLPVKDEAKLYLKEWKRVKGPDSETDMEVWTFDQDAVYLKEEPEGGWESAF